MREPYYTVESLKADGSVGYLVKRCGILMTQLAERRFQSRPISFSQWLVLIHLAQQQHICATELSEHLGHDMGALTRVVDELERRGFARRERSRRDRRAVEIAITAAGRRQAQSAKPIVVDLLNRLIEPFTDEEMDTLLPLLQRLLGHLQREVEPRSPASQSPAARPAAVASPRRARRKPSAVRRSAGGVA
jgi:DNA-binding MarR family transcriptional regulator